MFCYKTDKKKKKDKIGRKLVTIWKLKFTEILIKDIKYLLRVCWQSVQLDKL